jgi:hypothetical protein
MKKNKTKQKQWKNINKTNCSKRNRNYNFKDKLINVLNTKNNVGFIYVIVTHCYNGGMLHWKKWQNMYMMS